MARAPFHKWPRDEHARWIMAGNTFGRHLMAASREYALGRIPKSATPKERELAEKAALDAIYGVMMLLDGVSESRIDKDHVAGYKPPAETISVWGQLKLLRPVQIAPTRRSARIVRHGWVTNDFGEA